MYDLLLRAALSMTRQCWEQGMLSYALLQCGEKQLLSIAVHDMVLRQSRDGRLCNVEDTPAVTDSAFCIPAVWALREKEEYRKAAERNVDFLLNRAERAADGTLFHVRSTTQIWADSAAFLPYALALTGHEDAAVLQMRGILNRLYLPESGLYAHIWDEEKAALTDPRAWGVGNGWILTGLWRTSQCLKERQNPQWKRLRDLFYALLFAILRHMTKEYGFCDVLDEPDSFRESETAAMVALGLIAAVKAGEMERTYLDTALSIRKRLLEQTDENGLVWSASSSPFFDRPGTAVECQAHMMMLEKTAEGL